MNSFEDFNLPKGINQSLKELTYQEPTLIQQKSFKAVCSGRDVLAIAPTGTGKTLAYLLPVLKMYKYSTTPDPKILILVPTRELVLQITEVALQITSNIPIRVLGVYGGVNIKTQKKLISEGIDLLVGTPGRVMDLGLDGILNFSSLQKLIIDEFDEVLNLGFKFQLTSIFTMMKEKRQNILFSATMTDGVDEMIDEYFTNPVEVTLVKPGTTLDKIEQIIYFCPNFLTKINYLIELLQQDASTSKVLIFVNTKKQVELVAEKIEEIFPNEFGIIHSNKSQNYRINRVTEFQNNELRGLITTDVMARGLDISDVSHVINIEIPENPQMYVHRIGRTGRADKKGTAISFISTREDEYFFNIQLLMNKEVDYQEFPYDAEIIPRLLAFEKNKEPKVKQKKITKTQISEGGAFHQKKTKNTKINLGGPTKRKPPKTKPTNRGAQKRKK